MSGLVELAAEQSEQLQSLEAAWKTYGPALQVAAEEVWAASAFARHLYVYKI